MESYKTNLKKFISIFLRQANVKDEYIKEFTSDINMIEFTKAFTHPSYDPENNYELLEFLGDTIVNASIAFYIKYRFPKIINVGWLTRLKHILVSKKTLALLSEKHGLSNYIRYGDSVKDEIEKDPDLKTNKTYLSMLEDVVEAFFGCLMNVIQSSGRLIGVGFEISNSIIWSFLDPLEISLKYEDVFDSVTRLKQLYESNIQGLKWPVKQTYVTNKISDTKYEAIAYGWPLNDKKYNPEHPEINRKILGREEGKTIDIAKELAANKAISKLINQYKMVEIQPDMYKIVNKYKGQKK